MPSIESVPTLPVGARLSVPVLDPLRGAHRGADGVAEQRGAFAVERKLAAYARLGMDHGRDSS